MAGRQEASRHELGKLVGGDEGAELVRQAEEDMGSLGVRSPERYALMLRLYDTPVGVATRTQRDAPMPQIATVGCP